MAIRYDFDEYDSKVPSLPTGSTKASKLSYGIVVWHSVCFPLRSHSAFLGENEWAENKFGVSRALDHFPGDANQPTAGGKIGRYMTFPHSQ